MLNRSAETAVQRVALVASSGRILADLVPPLVRRLLSLRHKPVALATDFPAGTSHFLTAIGCEVEILPSATGSLNPFSDFMLRRQLSAVLSARRPHAILAYDLGSAAKLASLVRRISNARLAIALPSSGIEEAGEGIVVAPGIERQLRDICGSRAVILLPNDAEVRNLQRSDLIGDATIAVAPQSGIDLAAHPPEALPSLREGFTFAVAAEDLTASDITTIVAAAKIVAEQSHGTRLVIAGAVASERERARLADLIGECTAVTWNEGSLAFAQALGRCHAVVHPSAAPGLTGSLLAALAAGRPLVAADTAGVRDTVDQIVNGILVRPSDIPELADAMLAIVRRADMLSAMATASRLKAERRFDAHVVNAALLSALRIPAALGSAA